MWQEYHRKKEDEKHRKMAEESEEWIPSDSSDDVGELKNILIAFPSKTDYKNYVV